LLINLPFLAAAFVPHLWLSTVFINMKPAQKNKLRQKTHSAACRLAKFSLQARYFFYHNAQ
jgi:hypothetical protein